MILSCSRCGKEFYRSPANVQKNKKVFCSKACYNAARKEEREKETPATELLTTGPNGERRAPHEAARILITAELPLLPQLRPERGRVYEAEKYRTQHRGTGYIIAVRGKRVYVRAGECREV